MTFDTITRSRRRARPVELYLFRYGPGATDYYAYNDGLADITFDAGDDLGAVTYTPFAIDRSTIDSSGTLDKAELSVKTASNASITSIFQIYPPNHVITLTIRQGNIGDTDFLVVWAGRILSCKFTDSEAELTCEPVSTSLRRAGLRRNYQIGCPLALYSVGPGLCNANKDLARTTVNAVTAAGAVVTLPSDWAADSAAKLKFRGGTMEWYSEFGLEIRSILKVSVSDDKLTLAGLARGLTDGHEVNVYLGCNHMLDDCEFLHNNIKNYGGQWLIPIKTPFRGMNNFY